MSAFFKSFLEACLTAGHDFSVDEFRVVLVDLNDFAQAITGATSATPIVVTSAAHGYSNGQTVDIAYAAGLTMLNATWEIQNVTTNTYELVGSVGAGQPAWTSGGLVVNLDLLQDLADIPSGARVAVSSALSGKTFARGIIGASSIDLTGVSGDIAEAVIVYKHTGTDATSTLMCIKNSGTGLPITPNGGTMTVNFGASIGRLATP